MHLFFFHKRASLIASWPPIPIFVILAGLQPTSKICWWSELRSSEKFYIPCTKMSHHMWLIFARPMWLIIFDSWKFEMVAALRRGKTKYWKSAVVIWVQLLKPFPTPESIIWQITEYYKYSVLPLECIHLRLNLTQLKYFGSTEMHNNYVRNIQKIISHEMLE